MPEKFSTSAARYASLDLGSNTIRLLVSESTANGFHTVLSSQIITRLGEGMHRTGTLSPVAMERTIKGIESLLAEAEKLKPFRIAAVATHAVRSAKNREEFKNLFSNRTGFPLSVIEWESEAGLALKGVESAINKSGPILLFDIGGGSTEFIYRDAGGGIRSVGTNIGVVRLTESYIRHAPLVMSEYKTLESELKNEIRGVKEKLDIKDAFTLVGTAGTVTSIAALHLGMEEYDPDRITNTILRDRDIKKVLEEIGKMTLEERGKLNPLKSGREDLVIPGICIILCIMDIFGIDKLTVCDSGLREGALLSLKDSTLAGYDI